MFTPAFSEFFQRLFAHRVCCLKEMLHPVLFGWLLSGERCGKDEINKTFKKDHADRYF